MDFLYSYLSIIALLVLTGCGLPVPEEAFIIAAGIAASFNTLNPILAFAACMIGALIGDTVMYGMGRYFGRGLMRRSGWWAKVFNAQTEARAEQMIKRHGLKVFLLARFLVGVRAPMYIAAGILRIPLTRFLFIDGICATVVIATVFGLSWKFGHHFEPVWQRIHQSQVALTIAIATVAVIAGLYLLWLLRRRRKALQAPCEDAATLGDLPAIATQQHAGERLEEAHGVG